MPLERKISELARLQVQVHGLVQGVSFRWFVQRRARELQLTGFVRNLPDGSVLVVAEGERGSLETLTDALRVGPSAAVVESTDTEWAMPTGEFDRFEVRY